MEETLSIVAIVVAVALAIWQWRVVMELRAIHDEIAQLRRDHGGPVPPTSP